MKKIILASNESIPGGYEGYMGAMFSDNNPNSFIGSVVSSWFCNASRSKTA
jgi:hypothetical protein